MSTNSMLAMRLKRIRFTNFYPPSDPTGRRLFFAGCDMQARDLLTLAALDLIPKSGDWDSAAEEEAAHRLLHADLYLKDRLAYELFRDGVILEHWRKAENSNV